MAPDVTDVKLRNSYQICHVMTNNLFVRCGSACIVETEHGIDLGRVCLCRSNTRGVESEVRGKLLRVPTEADYVVVPELESIEKKAFDICKVRAKEKGLEMKLISVKCLFDKTKIIFYFVAENRIDFRELVRDLAAVFRTRIEMRQIGVRDEARLVGGYGPCGRELCCSHMKENFDPVSIKMAKEQSLNLNSMKISGMCGRLLCCLSYEYEVYRELNRGLPPVGAEVHVAQRIYVVDSVDALREIVRLKYENRIVDVSSGELKQHGGRFTLSEELVRRITSADDDESEDVQPRDKPGKHRVHK